MKITTRNGVEWADVRYLRTQHRVTLVSGDHRSTDGRSLDGATVSGRAILYLASGTVWTVFYLNYEAPTQTIRVADASDGRILHVDIANVVDLRFFDERREPFHGRNLEVMRRQYSRSGE